MTGQRASNELRVAIAGLGSIGSKIATALDQGIEGLTLSAVAVRDPAKHQTFLSSLRRPPQIVPIDQLGDAADIVVECAPSSQLRAIVEPSVKMVTRKPIDGLKGAPFIVENNIDIDNLREPLKLFEGSAREAAKGFPANLNVAVALSLAGVGPDRTSVQIWADPTVTRNVHRIEVEADSARFSMSIENIPSENPKTGLITALSVIALLRKQRATLCVGT